MINGVTPTYPNLLEYDSTFPDWGKSNPPVKPSNVLLPEPFVPVMTVCFPFLILKLKFSNILDSESKYSKETFLNSIPELFSLFT